MESGNLQAASVYINNQLLSRGLLRDGQTIDFAALGNGHGSGSEAARRVISVINDLILRRDRDAEQRESMSTAMRNLRIENVKGSSDMSALADKAADAQRRLDIAQVSEASMRAQVRSAEGAMRGLREELARTKVLVAQARASCATEIKRRDRQIETLKKAVGEAGRTRGAKGLQSVLAITVTGDDDGGGEEAQESLGAETNAFLAAMAQRLGEEKETVVRAMRETTAQLREMSGWSGGRESRGSEEVVRPARWEEVSAELDAVMEHMRDILTNPSFVPIEEVLVREEEIERLKAGWFRMESRWEDAVRLMDGWRRRMVDGKPVDAEELEMGMGLGMAGDDGESGSEFAGFADEIQVDEHGVQIVDGGEGSSPLPEPPQLSPLRETGGKGRRQGDEGVRGRRQGDEGATGHDGSDERSGLRQIPRRARAKQQEAGLSGEPEGRKTRRRVHGVSRRGDVDPVKRDPARRGGSYDMTC